MKSYIVILQLGYPEDSYTSLISFLKSSEVWTHPLHNFWVVKTASNSAYIRDGVMKRINPSDKVFVTEVNGNNWASFNLAQQVADWLKYHL